MVGKKNIVSGLWFLAGFMLYGFVLIYLRDFAPNKEAWIASYSVGSHFESRLAHVHGNLFALINKRGNPPAMPGDSSRFDLYRGHCESEISTKRWRSTDERLPEFESYAVGL